MAHSTTERDDVVAFLSSLACVEDYTAPRRPVGGHWHHVFRIAGREVTYRHGGQRDASARIALNDARKGVRLSLAGRDDLIAIWDRYTR